MPCSLKNEILASELNISFLLSACLDVATSMLISTPKSAAESRRWVALSSRLASRSLSLAASMCEGWALWKPVIEKSSKGNQAVAFDIHFRVGTAFDTRELLQHWVQKHTQGPRAGRGQELLLLVLHILFGEALRRTLCTTVPVRRDDQRSL